MNVKQSVLVVALGAAAGAAAALAIASRVPPAKAIPEEPAAPRPLVVAQPLSFDSAQLTTGRLSMERLPLEIGQALDTQSEEIVKNAEAIETRQARITGTCAPGSAIRLIAEDGTVRCQRFPRGVVSVAAIFGVPLNAATTSAVGNVTGGVGRYQTGGEDDLIAVPIALPDGAIVTSFTFAYFDNSAESDTAAYLYRSDARTLAEVQSDGASETVRTATTDHIDLRKVDAGQYAYAVLFRLSARAGAALLPISASVGYRLP